MATKSNYVFQKIAQQASAAGITANQTRASREWFRTAATAVSSVDPERLIKDPIGMQVTQRITVNEIGKMCMFFYDPKLKDELPYYDRFPLIFPIEIYKDGFLGINLHYLPPYLRAKLMDALYSIVEKKGSDLEKLKVTYQTLKGAARYRYFKPCVKRYLWSHVQTKTVIVKPPQWDVALMLPTERFTKASKDVVHAESAKMVLRK